MWFETDLARATSDGFSVWGNRFIAASGWASPARISDYGGLISTFTPNLAVAPNGDAMAIWTRAGEVRVNTFD